MTIEGVQIIVNISCLVSLPNKSEFGNVIQDKVLESCSKEILKAENGLEKLIEFLKKTLGKENIEDLSQKWEEFENCKRKDGEKIEDFVAEFERKYKWIVKMKMLEP